jgi:dTDP-4-dehydrorhamnose 3,5-epimerase
MIKTKFKDLFVVQNKTFNDKRGYFKELIREKDIDKKFPFMVMSYSKKNVIRGLHLQRKKSQGKFISVIKGKIFDVAVDLRKTSKTFGKILWVYFKRKKFKIDFYTTWICSWISGSRKRKSYYIQLHSISKLRK